ncbi:hypothetical protein VTO42DRAFT_2313 [Malbranchea cinnamomea]
MNRPGPGQQPLRGMSSFPAQQQLQTRPMNTLPSSRLPGGKLGASGNASNWGFGLPAGGTPGLQNNQRTVNTMNTTFAQSVGGSQAATPLDLSEFPSLSGGPQIHTPNPSQAIWANATQRAAQHNVLQRQAQGPVASQPVSRSSQPQSHQQQSQSHTPHDDSHPPGTQFNAQLDDMRSGSIIGQLPSGNQPQPGSIEEFPPLGKGTPVDLGQERRDNMLQGGTFGNYGNGTAAINTSRSPMSQVPNGLAGQEKEDMSGVTSNVPSDQPQQTQPQLQAAQQQQTNTYSGDGTEVAGMGQGVEQNPLAQMTEQERFGLPGLRAMIHSESADIASLTFGQDLMSLGLDLNQAEPLHESFASPFVATAASAPLQPEFTLPACYNVANVQPLQTRIPSFSDETLFYIFYSMPRDIMQELVAEELMTRKWRYHKVERMWLKRDEQFPNPVEIERGISERGVYLWWDTNTWKKVRREFILRYADLDNHLDPGRSFIRGMAFPQST